MDVIGRCSVVSYESQPVVTNCRSWRRSIDRPPQFITQRHGYNIWVRFCPFSDEFQTSFPVVDREVVVVEPGISIWGKKVS